MSAWGKGGIAKSCDSLLKRVEQNDPNLTDLIILPTKTFGTKEINRIVAVIESGKNTNLKSLSASGHAISSDSLSKLSKAITTHNTSHQLRSLAIGDRTMGDQGICALCQGIGINYNNFPLEEIDISWKGIQSQGMDVIVQTLGKCNKLKVLNLARNEGIGSSTILIDGAKRRDVIQGGEQQEADNNEKTKTSLKLFSNLQNLDVTECNINDKSCIGLVHLLQPLDVNQSLTLRLTSNPIMYTGFNSICTLLHGSSIVELYLSNCSLGDKGIESLVNWSSSTTGYNNNNNNTYHRTIGLKVLDLSNNNITSAGLHLLVNLLQKQQQQQQENKDETSVITFFPSLFDLNLSCNKFDETSVQPLAETLGNLKQIGKLNLSILDMTETCCGSLGAASLVRLAHLTSLRLFNNNLKCSGFLELTKELQGGHETLENLDLGGNHAKEDAVVSLLQALISVQQRQQQQQKENDGEINNKNKLKVLVVGGNEGGPSLEKMVKEVKRIHPNLDIARDKSKRPGQQESSPFGNGPIPTNLPPGLFQS